MRRQGHRWDGEKLCTRQKLWLRAPQARQLAISGMRRQGYRRWGTAVRKARVRAQNSLTSWHRAGRDSSCSEKCKGLEQLLLERALLLSFAMHIRFGMNNPNDTADTLPLGLSSSILHPNLEAAQSSRPQTISWA